MIYLAAALIVLWLLVTGLVLSMALRQRALERELALLEEELQERRPAD